MKGVSLVMATLGRVQEVGRFLDALHAQTCRDFELLVVDQNPDDRLVPILDAARQRGLEIVHLRQDEANQCLARNLGMSRARHEWVAFPDDDCWYEPDVIEKLLARVSEPAALDGLVIRWQEVDPHGSQPHRLSNARWRQYREVSASSITQFFRRDVLSRLGGFDPALGLHSWFGGGEETDLMFRVLASGAHVAYTPDVVVHHPVKVPVTGDVAGAFSRGRARARGTGALYAKHALSAWVISRGLLAPLGRAVISLSRPGVAAEQLGVFLGRLEGWWHWPKGRRAP